MSDQTYDVPGASAKKRGNGRWFVRLNTSRQVRGVLRRSRARGAPQRVVGGRPAHARLDCVKAMVREAWESDQPLFPGDSWPGRARFASEGQRRWPKPVPGPFKLPFGYIIQVVESTNQKSTSIHVHRFGPLWLDSLCLIPPRELYINALSDFRIPPKACAVTYLHRPYEIRLQ